MCGKAEGARARVGALTNVSEAPPSPPPSVYTERSQYSRLHLRFTAVTIDRKAECALCSRGSEVTRVSHRRFSTMEKVQ